MEKVTKGFMAVLGGIALVASLCLILGFPAMWLWNWLMPIIFHLPEISFWQAIGLMFLSYLILPGKSVPTSIKK